MVLRDKELEDILGIHFLDPGLLQQALVHRSYLNENPTTEMLANERLEFLGDSIIDYLAAEYLFQRFPDMQEGGLTALRAALVKTESLASFAGGWNLGEHLLLGRGEEAAGGRTRPAILCGAFEAVVGALYLDRGMEAVRQVVLPLISQRVDQLLAETTQPHAESSLQIKDAKSRLQELAQSWFHLTPSYRTVAQRGPDHEKEFTVEVLIGDVPKGRGTGRSKQLAEQAAAQEALAQLEAESLLSDSSDVT